MKIKINSHLWPPSVVVVAHDVDEVELLGDACHVVTDVHLLVTWEKTK